MCLTLEWFSASSERKKRWDLLGLSVKEAESALDYYNSTCYPIASEVADYIYANWSENQISSLSAKAQQILIKVKENQ